MIMNSSSYYRPHSFSSLLPACISLLLLFHQPLVECFTLSSFSPLEILSHPRTQPPSSLYATNNNFEDWISDAPEETSRKQLNIEGSIPAYVNGFLIRNGGAQWTNGNEMCTHIFDGLAKVSMYDIQHNKDKATSSVHFQTKFVKSKWYDKVNQSKGIPASISIGPIVDRSTKEKKTGLIRNLMTLVNMSQFDNPCVNIWDYNEPSGDLNQVSAITDAPPRAQIAMRDLNTISSSTQTPSTSQLEGYELFCTTHPEYSKTEKGVTYNAGIELGLEGAKVILTEERDSSTIRRVVARSDTLEGIPYCHSFGINGKYATVVLQPLRGKLDIGRILEEGYFSIMDHLDYTQIIVFDLETGRVKMDQKIDEKIYFYHAVSAAEDLSSKEPNVSMRLCAYKTPDIITGEDQFMKLDKCTGVNGKENRDLISRGGTFCDVTINLKGNSVKVHWKDEIKQGFELPTTRYSRASGLDALRTHPRFVYAYSAYANGSEEYDSWGLFKFDMEKDCIDTLYQQSSRYVSEPIFVSDPNGSDEDDGALLSQIYDGNRRETALLVLDAKNLEVLATVWTGQRSPMDFHGTFIRRSKI